MLDGFRRGSPDLNPRAAKPLGFFEVETQRQKLQARILDGARNRISKVLNGPATAGLASVRAETLGTLLFFLNWILDVRRWRQSGPMA